MFSVRPRLRVFAAILALGLTGCTASSLSDASPSPHGSITAGCEMARETSLEPVSAGDLVVGPVRYWSLAQGYTLYEGVTPEPDSDGLTFYKIGPSITGPGSWATVSIGEPDRSYAGILVEGHDGAGYSEVTYRSCEDLSPNMMDWWVGGFILKDRSSACVPIEITTSENAEVRHFDLALPAGACD